MQTSAFLVASIKPKYRFGSRASRCVGLRTRPRDGRSRGYCGRPSASVYLVLETGRAGRWITDFGNLLWTARYGLSLQK